MRLLLVPLLAASVLGVNAAEPANLGLVATASTSFVSGHERLGAINDGFTPADARDKSHGAYGNWPRTGTQWVQYDWAHPISTREIQVYWYEDGGGLALPSAARLKYWNGTAFVPVPGAKIGVEPGKFNTAGFPEISTPKLRLEFDSSPPASTAILEWRVLDSGKTPNFPPTVNAGVERTVIVTAKTYLRGTIKDDGKPSRTLRAQWSRECGPGRVAFENAHDALTSARFSKPGEYVLKLAADDGEGAVSDTVRVNVEPPPPSTHLEPVWTTHYSVTSPFWRGRFKPILVKWLPYCIAKIDDPGLDIGGIENFVQAANALAGKPAKHTGAAFANAWVYNTFESMCLALTIDPLGDPEIIESQKAIRAKMEEWLPKLLGAQEPDGYLQTKHTIEKLPRWRNNNDCEDYNAGYFMDAAIAHYFLTQGQDTRMLDAAVRLADCYDRNIGPAPKKSYFGWHQGIEQSLVRLVRVLEEKDGPRAGKRYVTLAKFIMDARRNGDEYDQTHLPVVEQYEIVGHSVRAAYGCSGMADIAMETGDVQYYSAVKSLWDNLVNKKYYLTGGIGSGESSEGFGPDYSLPNRSYCESCAGCGEIFFQHKMQLACRESRYADLFEETLFNNVLGGLDLAGENFYYPNPLEADHPRSQWHVCPCCVGNIPRTLFMLPTWAYARDQSDLYINLFFGSSVTVSNIAGTSVQVIQQTDYPWEGKVSITLNPAAAKRFSLNIRVPNRQVSKLYSATPAVEGLTSLSLNGSAIQPKIEHGYVVLHRKWKAGDRIDLVLPMKVQRVKADPRVTADAGRVALRFGPLIYDLESVDQSLDAVLSPVAPLDTEWQPDFLGGVRVIRGEFTDGRPMMAVPNYARQNRGGRSIVWLKDE